MIDDEQRIDEVGATATGRVLRIVTTIRNNKIRVVTAFDAPKQMKDRLLYGERSSAGVNVENFQLSPMKTKRQSGGTTIESNMRKSFFKRRAKAG